MFPLARGISAHFRLRMAAPREGHLLAGAISLQRAEASKLPLALEFAASAQCMWAGLAAIARGGEAKRATRQPENTTFAGIATKKELDSHKSRELRTRRPATESENSRIHERRDSILVEATIDRFCF